MDSILLPAANFLAHHQALAGVALGLVTLFESLVIVGAFVPATALMIIAGGLIAAGVLEPTSVIIGCVVGAIFGDAISYLIVRRFGARLLRHPALTPHRRAIARTRLYCRRYGVSLIYVGRFFGPLRAFVPVVVGILQMRQHRFQTANVVSAMIWAPVMLAPGYFAARGLARVEAVSEADPLTIGIIVAGVAAVAAFAVWRVLRSRALQRAAAAAACAC